MLVLLGGFVAAQEATKPNSTPALAPAASHVAANEVTIPEGTRIPVMLKNAVSTKSSRVGDPIYAQSTFPVVVNDHIVVPAGTYVQGKISQIKPAGHLKGRAEVLVHYTTLIYPSGYTVVLPGAVEPKVVPTPSMMALPTVTLPPPPEAMMGTPTASAISRVSVTS